jgi:hypothetical protein
MTRSGVAEQLVVGPVDLDLLREQRDWLLTLYGPATPLYVDGLVELLDHMLDVGEGFVPSI